MGVMLIQMAVVELQHMGYDLWSSTYCEILACVALERKPRFNSYQQQNATSYPPGNSNQ